LLVGQVLVNVTVLGSEVDIVHFSGVGVCQFAPHFYYYWH